MSARRENWQQLLADYIESVRLKPFQWGVHDCGLFATAAVEAMTGIDPAKDLRGTYSDQAGAETLYGGGCLGDLAHMTFSNAGYREMSPANAWQGDVVLVRTRIGPTLGVCMGIKVAIPGETGLVNIPRSRGIRAWKIE